MKEIVLSDVLFTGAMLFAIFYGSIIITKFFSKEDEKEDSTEEK